MVDSETVRKVFLPDPDDCFAHLRDTRFGDEVTCPHCGSDHVIKKGKTPKGAQKYYCKACDTYFNDLTGTVFEHHGFPIEEMFYMIQGMETKSTKQIAEELDRNYKAVLNFVHEVQDLASQHMEEVTLEGVCEADEIYVTAGEKGGKTEDAT